MVKVAVLRFAPGARNAPDPLPVPTVTLPAIVPVEPSVPALTFTAPVPVPELRLLLTNSVPAVTVVDPVYVFDPLSVKVPVPIFVREPPVPPPIPPSWMIPEKVVFKLLAPTV